jgi:hypothetical protein
VNTKAAGKATTKKLYFFIYSFLRFTVSWTWRLSLNSFHFEPTPEAIGEKKKKKKNPMPPHRTTPSPSLSADDDRKLAPPAPSLSVPTPSAQDVHLTTISRSPNVAGLPPTASTSPFGSVFQASHQYESTRSAFTDAMQRLSDTLTMKPAVKPPPYEAAMAQMKDRQKIATPKPTDTETGEAMTSPRLRGGGTTTFTVGTECTRSIIID